MRPVVFIHRFESLASYRYRAKMPAEYVGAEINGGAAEIAVFCKSCQDDLELARSLKAQGCKIVVDFCDDHFNHAGLGNLYRDFAKLADCITCPTEEMGRRIPAEVKAHVIPDPYEMEEVKPHANGEQMLWFGHNRNLPDLGSMRDHDKLRIVSGPKVEDGITHWSPENIARAMSEANLALFPTRKGSEYKSANRLLNAVRQGLFPICHPHPAYAEFRGLAWIGEVKAGIRWANHFKEDLNILVEELQCQIRHKYSPDTIGNAWKDLLESI